MSIRIALAGNPNSGKTTLFNLLTGSNQFVGNWPGVTVEKKEGKLKKYDDVIVTDLPGIYSLSPYSPEEVVARSYLIDERPDAIVNIVDATNLERNLYLTTQLSEIGIPVVVALNMMDLVRKSGDRIDTAALAARLGCQVLEISALKGEGVARLAEEAVRAATGKRPLPQHTFAGVVEHAIAHIEEAVLHDEPQYRQRWYAIKIFERDKDVLSRLRIDTAVLSHVEEDIRAAEREMDDDAESIITGQRYVFVAEVIRACYRKKERDKLSVSDRIDRVVTNRWLGLPIFALIMFLVYFLAMAPHAPGTMLTDWANDGVFGDEGWHLFGIGRAAYEEKAEEFTHAENVLDAFVGLDEESDVASVRAACAEIPANAVAEYDIVDDETLAVTHVTYTYADLTAALEVWEAYDATAPDPADDGVFVPSIPALVGRGLDAVDCAEWLKGLLLDGVIAGVGAVLGFVPQMLVLFLLLACLEACGYMARIAFVLDRIFRRFGLSGKSFIPMLVGTGCGVPGIMASRTIENERDRRMTVITTTFIPCSAKIPFIAMIAGAVFGGSAWIATGAYFIGMAAVIVSGLMLKKTRMFAGDPAPFVMELPAYHWPTVTGVLRSMWERGWSFIKKAGTIILLSTILVWFTSYFGFVDGTFRMLSEEELDRSVLAAVGGAVAWLFAPLGWGSWQAAVASFTGLIAKENIVGTMGVLYGGGEGSVYASLAASFTPIAAFSFLVFNLLCAPCFAAMGAIKREMNSRKWTWFAIGYQCLFAYAVSLVIYQIGRLFGGSVSVPGLLVALALVAGLVYMLFFKGRKTAETPQ